MHPNCKHFIVDSKACHVASELAKLVVTVNPVFCEQCTKHPTLPQRINGITCGLARNAQIVAGLEPDPNLLDCVVNEQLPISIEKLEAAHYWWDRLHSFKLKHWNAFEAQNFYNNHVLEIPDFDCDCKQGWLEITKHYPIIFTSYPMYFISGWFAHNCVNIKLFKDWFPLEKAMEKYEAVFF